MLRALSRHAAMVRMLSRHSGRADSYTTPGPVFLAHEDSDTILADYRLLRQLEADHALFLSA